MGIQSFALVLLLVASVVLSCSAMPFFFKNHGGGSGQSLESVAAVLTGGDAYSDLAFGSLGAYGGLGNFDSGYGRR